MLWLNKYFLMCKLFSSILGKSMQFLNFSGIVYFEVFTLWPHGRVAANKNLPYFDHGSVAVGPQPLL